jgi:hypothetical protein
MSLTNRESIFRDLARRRLLFGNYCTQNGIRKTPCPSCGFPTLNSRASFGYCFLCGWEDDGQDDADADTVLGGPNVQLSLTESRLQFGQKLATICAKKNRVIVIDPATIVPLILQWSDDFQKINQAIRMNILNT